LSVAKAHTPSDFVAAREAQLASKQGDHQTAKNLLEQLCQSPQASQWCIRTASEAVREIAGSIVLEKLLEKFVSPKCNAEVAPVLVESIGARGEWRRCRKILKNIRDVEEIWNRAALSYLKSLQTSKQPFLIRWFVSAHWKRLQAQTWTWGYVAEVLSEVDLDRLLLKWCRDWRTRSELRPRMLFFPAVKLRYAFRDQEATEVNRFAVTLALDETSPVHQLWLAIEELITQGWTPEVESRVNAINAATLTNFYREMLETAKAMCEVSTLGVERPTYAEARRRLYSAAGNDFMSAMKTHPAHRILRHRLEWRLAQDRNLGARALYHRFRIWSIRFIH
jgi:hypothetical protein